ncbi:MAG TPA: hypothetical protein VHL78_14045 [Actinomycetota bacterium]|nr:hypothetical protein [Actinomycetota bacterium]
MDVGKIGRGGFKFWDGEYVEKASVSDCSDPGAKCWDYKLTLAQPGARLRVALDILLHGVRYSADTVPDAPGVHFLLQVFDPTGVLIAESDSPMTTELFIEDPMVGTWTLRVRPSDVEDKSFRMRAKLEKRGQLSGGRPKPLLPNLRSIPPFEVTFLTPLWVYGPAVDPTEGTTGCLPEEILDEGMPSGRCLRFSAGPENAGPGNLELRYRPHEFVGGDPTVHPVHQRIHYSDGSYRDGAPGSAGVTEFHIGHGHFHYDDMYNYELYRVVAPGVLEQLSPGSKRGFLPRSEVMAEWFEFTQQPKTPLTDPKWWQWAVPDESLEGAFRIPGGWGDVYEYNRTGQFVDFPTNPDGTPMSGEYVLRTQADKQRLIAERDETDNLGYAHFRVDGLDVTILERGHGSDPWDRSKVVRTKAP